MEKKGINKKLLMVYNKYGVRRISAEHHAIICFINTRYKQREKDFI